MKKIAKGSLYAAPVVATMATPGFVEGQGAFMMGGLMMGGSGMMMMAQTQERQLPDAPWFKPPPGKAPSSTPPGGRDAGE